MSFVLKCLFPFLLHSLPCSLLFLYTLYSTFLSKFSLQSTKRVLVILKYLPSFYFTSNISKFSITRFHTYRISSIYSTKLLKLNNKMMTRHFKYHIFTTFKNRATYYVCISSYSLLLDYSLRVCFHVLVNFFS